MQRSILARLQKSRREKGPDSDGRSGVIRWRWALVALVVAALAAWGIRDHWAQGRFQWKTFAGTFADLRWQWVAASYLLLLATYYGRVLRWAVMLRPLRPHPSRWGLFKATTIGFTAVLLLGRPGEFVRPYLISLKEQVPLSSQFAAWFLERICDLLAILLLFGFALSQIRSSSATLNSGFEWVLQTGGYVVAALVLVCLTILVLMGKYPAIVRQRLSAALTVLPDRYHARIDRLVGAFMDGTASTTSQGSALQLVLYTAAEWAMIVVGIGCLFRAHTATAGLELQDVLIFMGFISFGSVLQIPGVGGGVQIVSIVVLTRLYQVPFEIATGLAIMVWMITFVGVLPIGITFAFHEGINWRKLRDLEQRAVRAGSTAEEPLP